MSLVRWEPFSDMTALREQVNRLFEQSLARTGREPVAAQMWSPLVDIHETDSAVVLRVEVPGVKPEAIDIQLLGDTLTIKGERTFERESQGRQYLRIERSYGAFQRSFTLGVAVQQDQVKAAYKDGVLDVTLPKAESSKPRQVKVQVEGEPTTIDGA